MHVVYKVNLDVYQCKLRSFFVALYSSLEGDIRMHVQLTFAGCV